MSGRGNWQGKALAPGQYTRSMLAERAETSERSIRRWQEEGFITGIRKGNMWVFGDKALEIAIRLKQLEKVNLETRYDIIMREFGNEP